MEEKIKSYFAHSLPNQPQSTWQLLKDHLNETANLSKSFADKFDSGNFGYLIGLFHDIGKYSEKFQNRLTGSNVKVDHSSAGAKEIYNLFSEYKNANKILSYPIAGHHGGLPNGKDNTEYDLMTRISSKQLEDYCYWKKDIVLPRISNEEWKHCVTSLKRSNNQNSAFAFSLLIRMLFSCLVDADRLNTESVTSFENSLKRDFYPSLISLKAKFDEYLKYFENIENSLVNQQRKEVLIKCIKKANLSRGIYSLTVPTGGGKTLSSMAFALNHAIKYGLDRIIYVIPYTSIIEQNAAIFREAFGDLGYSVLEHHSNFDQAKLNYEDDYDVQSWELSVENWDAPIVVTTNVQFFESLFSNNSSRCRKLHNIANSVVILDEVQMLPVNLLYPCIRAIEELSVRYKATILLCSATQPALESRTNFNGIKFDESKEIVGDEKVVDKLFKDLERVKIAILQENQTDESLSNKIKQHNQVLCIVNTRGRAKRVYELLKNESSKHIFHLSANMCAEHRTEKLREIELALKKSENCIVISTQVIEAGVDIDFPVVYREISGIDSIAQAAGRCNREGKQKFGYVYVFEHEKGVPAIFRQQTDCSLEVMRHHENILSLSAIKEYFELYYWRKGDKCDSQNLMELIASEITEVNIPFRDISEKFKIIDDYSIPVLIPWGKEKDLIKSLKEDDFDKKLLRKLQRFIVNVTPNIFNKHRSISIEYIIPEKEQYAVLLNESIYSAECGLLVDDPYYRKEEQNIV
ncbi:MAG: CRISPR-associated helicase Cas3' [bacterium]